MKGVLTKVRAEWMGQTGNRKILRYLQQWETIVMLRAEKSKGGNSVNGAQ